jgi:protein-S-isoprenylcysteine O-methyltransferase Ste14
MEFLPPIQIILEGGWVLLVVYIVVIGGIMFTLPRDVVARLYDTSKWTKRQRRISKIAKLFLLIGYGFASAMPLTLGSFEFRTGITLYVLGLLMFYSAIRSYSETPDNQVVTKELYKVSRNPQQVSLFLVFLGIGLAVGSYFVLLITVVGIILSHMRILAEEEQCLSQYGDSYREYMKSTPRYLIFF